MVREIRLHGRGGQGAVTAGDMIVTASVMAGNYGASFPVYGDARRGAPVVTYVNLGDEPVRQKTQVYYPDCLIVLDPRQREWPETYAGLKPGGILLLNYGKDPEKQFHPNLAKAGVVDATKIAMEEIGIPAFNTALLGAFAATSGWISLDAILKVVEGTFRGELLAKNIRSTERGYQEVKIFNW